MGAKSMQLPRKISLILGIPAMLFCLTSAHALAVSEVFLNSHLNQRLNASVDLLSVSPEELDSLVVLIRPADEQGSASLTWPKLTHEIISDKSGRHVIKLSSDKPIQEPVINFILELSWSGGRLEREYVLLIDPDTD